MNYTTVFKRGDQVFFMKDNAIASALVYSIQVSDTPKGVFVSYYLGNDNFSKMEEGAFKEATLYASKDILRAAL